MRSLLTTRDPIGPFLAGVLTGFLPCGLVYAMLALAAASGSLAAGAAVMGAFGVGTLPIMTALGLGASLAGIAWRARMLRLAALSVIVVGVISLGRGASAWQTSRFENGEDTPAASAAPPTCPLCAVSKTGQ
jgi:sulfite exporter TauE/SafE